MQRVLVFLVLAASSAGLVRAQSASYQPDEKIKQEILQFADEQNHAVTTADIDRVARKYLDRNKFAVLVVGKAADFDKSLDTFGQVTTVDITIPQPGAATRNTGGLSQH